MDREPAKRIVVDGNEAAASVAYRLNEVVGIYPITPASPMGEHADRWAAEGRPNLWGAVPDVTEMQSEAGAAGTVHGALQGGALATTFTASQGLLLMIPNLYKIAGELTPVCLHVAARTIATHALSIFGDHSDVMACRQTGVAMLCSGSVQEAHDFALLGQAASFASRVPFVHFFDGFRTSHEIATIEELSDDDLRAMTDEDRIRAHREHGLSPDRPVLRGSAQNPDVFFQAREAANSIYDACPGELRKLFDRFATLTGRRYHLFDYVGHPEAERVVVLMGSGAEVAHEAVEALTALGDRVGVLKVRLYRPFDVQGFLDALPTSTRSLAVLDRTKEPGAPAEPLFLDVLAALEEGARSGHELAAQRPRVIGGRYGLSSKEFTPAMVRAVFDELARPEPRSRFTVGIVDDVTHLSLDIPELSTESDDVYRAVFYGLGSDGTVGANKNTIKIVGKKTGKHVQGYFVYDSKKAGATTVSHLRISPRPIRSSYLIDRANFLGCHQEVFLERTDVLATAAHGATFLLNTRKPKEELWDSLPREVQAAIIEKELRVFAIDAYALADQAKLGGRINTIMQTCFFALSELLSVDESVAEIKAAIERTYGGRGLETVHRNHAAVDGALAGLYELEVPGRVTATRGRPPLVAKEAPDLVQRVTAVMLAGKGDLLPVSAFPIDGTWPTATSQWEKHSLAARIPIWDADVCIQCNLCALVCPHAAIRTKAYAPAGAAAGPDGFRSTDCRIAGLQDRAYTVQVAPEDCTGCSLCVEVCPAKDKANPRHKAIDMCDQREHVDRERANFAHFVGLEELSVEELPKLDVKSSQLLQPLFEFSGACPGCGETPYIKLLTQLFGDRLVIANATGCSSIYGGNLPTTPYSQNPDGRGPAWANSLFEDNAEFGLGFRLAFDQLRFQARALVAELSPRIGEDLADRLLALSEESDQVPALRTAIGELRTRLAEIDDRAARRLEDVCDQLVARSVWLVGGDGWAYDIGYGGLDHVLAGRRNVNVLVLDTEVYSNTGGQQSKATPLGAVAKFASAGKEVPKKDLGLEAMSYGHVYVARVAFGAKPTQLVQVLQEAESYPGPSLVIAFSPCVAHGYDLKHGVDQQKLAVQTGYWNLYRYDPRRTTEGQPPLTLDGPKPKKRLQEYMRNEARFRTIERFDAARFRELQARAQADAQRRQSVYEQLARVTVPGADLSDEGGEQ